MAPPSLLEAIMDMEVMDSRADDEQDEEEGEEEKDACGGTGGKGPFLLVEMNSVKFKENQKEKQ